MCPPDLCVRPTYPQKSKKERGLQEPPLKHQEKNLIYFTMNFTVSLKPLALTERK